MIDGIYLQSVFYRLKKPKKLNFVKPSFFWSYSASEYRINHNFYDQMSLSTTCGRVSSFAAIFRGSGSQSLIFMENDFVGLPATDASTG
jgi:hypothetical protein